MRADARRNYEALVAAARDLFQEQGCDAPLDEVAKRAGVGAGTLYRHFPSRIDLLSALYVSDIEELCDRTEKLTEDLGPGAALSLYMDLQLESGLRNGGMRKAIRDMLDEGLEHPPALIACKGRMTELTTKLLDSAKAAGAARPAVDATSVVKLIHGITVSCETTPDLAPAMLDVVRAGVLREPQEQGSTR
jgi:AcrR family transcriptional regulator